MSLSRTSTGRPRTVGEAILPVNWGAGRLRGAGQAPGCLGGLYGTCHATSSVRRRDGRTDGERPAAVSTLRVCVIVHAVTPYGVS